MSGETILLERRDAAICITLNRPDRLNSFTETMHAELAAALDDAAKDDGIRAVLITGAGRAFCAGQDLSDRVMGEGGPPDLGDTLDRLYNPLVRRITALEKPVIAAVNGVAAGAGANVALACDIVIAGRSASFLQAFCKIGLIPDSGGTYFLPRLVGSARAAGLALLGDKLPAETAAEWGLIWQVVDDADLTNEAWRLADHLAKQPTRALAMIKQALAASATNDLSDQLDLERDLQRAAGRTADYQEGVQAFLQKRPANFQGR